MKKESRREHNPIHSSSDRAAQKARRLAPPEEQVTKKVTGISNNGGVINVDTGNLNLPREFTERDDGKSYFLGLEPLAAAILIFSIVFIAFITYLISSGPPKTQQEPPPAARTQNRSPASETYARN